MRSVSLAFNNYERADSKRVYVKLTWNGTKTVTSENIISFTLEETFANTDGVTIGGAFSAMAKLELVADGLTLLGSYFVPYISYDNSEYIPLGKFFVTEATINQDNIASVTAYDKMAFLDAEYTYNSAKQMSAIISEISTINSFEVVTTVYPTFDALPPLEEAVTYRQMIGYIAGLTGKNAIFNRDGKLEFKWYKASDYLYGDANLDGSIDASDVTYIQNNLMMKVHDGELASILGTMVSGKAILAAELGAHPNTRLADVNDDGMVTAADVAEIQAYINGEPYEDTLVGTEWHEQELTRDNYISFTKETDSLFSVNCLISGVEDNPVQYGSGKSISFTNPYMTQARLNAIGSDILPFTVFPAQVSWLPFASWEVGDITAIVEGNNHYRVPIMSLTMTYDGGLSGDFKAYGLSDEAAKVGTATVTEREIERNLGEKVKNVEAITNTISKELNGTVEYITNSEGKNTGLAIWNAAKNAGWIWTEGGFGYFNGQAVLPSSVAFDMYGNLNANYITTGTLSANMISAGTITGAIIAKDLTMEGGSINLSTSEESRDLITLNRTRSDTTFSTSMSADGITAKINSGTQTLLRYSGLAFTKDGTTQSISLNNGELSIGNVPIATTTYVNSQGFYGSGSTAYLAKCYLSNPGTISSGDPCYIYASNGQLCKYSSTRKVKHDITTELKPELDPHGLYDVDVVQFKFNDGVLIEEDINNGKDVLGLIAEDVYEKFPMGAVHDENGNCRDWDVRYIVPGMLKLIQEQKAEIEELKERINKLEGGNE